LFLVEEGNYFRNAFQVKEDKNNAKGKSDCSAHRWNEKKVKRNNQKIK
jgi:hypothetical protein